MTVRRLQTDPPTGDFPSSDQGPSRAEIGLTTLESLFQEIQGKRASAKVIHAALEAVAEGTGADVVFWFPGAEGEPLDVVAQRAISMPFCREFAGKLLAQTSSPETDLVWINPSAATNGADSTPASAVMVRPDNGSKAWIVAFTYREERPFDRADIQLIRVARRMITAQHQHLQTVSRLKETLVGLVRCLTRVVDAKDPCTCGHSERVARIGVRIGRQMGLSEKVTNDVYLAGLLHDVGKIGVRDAVLLKPGTLSAEEMAHIQEHVLIGDHIVGEITQLAHLRLGIRHHHERFDGQGYPDHLVGEDIPLLARILAVADACDAMMSTRRYRAALTPPQIDATMVRLAGVQWDPKITEAFMACREQIYPPIYQRGIGESALHAIDTVIDPDRTAEHDRRPVPLAD
jgi:HD-GYP domain-containing protein (c-di-GMP phosphodiesterase class II)